MPIRVSCPLCGASGQAPDALAGKKAKCQRCGTAIPVPSRIVKSAPPKSPAKPIGKVWQRLGIFGPLGWMVLGWGFALATPWLALTAAGEQKILHVLPIVSTLVWIAFGIYQAIGILGRTGRMASVVPLALVQFGLFTLLFFQVAAHLGTRHYHFDSVLTGWDWPAFALAHVVHAADLADFLEAFGVQLAVIQPRSALTMASLILFHLVFGLFFLGVAVEKVEPFTNNLFKQLVGWSVAALIVFFLAWVVTVEYIYPWSRTDMLLWVVDNFLRVIDVADILDVAHVELHQLRPKMWEATLTLACRLLMGLGLLSLLGFVWLRLRVRGLGGFGVSKETLEDQIEIYTKAALRKDAERLLAERMERPAPRQGGWELASLRTAVIDAAMSLLMALTLPLLAGLWQTPIQHLVQAALAEDEPQKTRALTELDRLGPYAEGVVPELAEGAVSLAGDQQKVVLDALAGLGNAGRNQLGRYLLGPDADLAHQALHSLQQAGPRAAPALVEGQFAVEPSMRRATVSALEELGPEASQALLDQFNPEQAWLVYPLLEKLDSSWPLRHSSNPAIADLRRIKDIIAVLNDVNSDGVALQDAANDLVRLGRPLAIPALPALQARLAKGPSQRTHTITIQGQVDGFQSISQAQQKLGQMPSATALILKNAVDKLSQPPLSAETLRRFDTSDPRGLATFVKDLGPQAKNTVPALEKLLNDDDNDVLLAALVSLRQSGFWQPKDPKSLMELMGRSHPAIQQNAIQGLGQMGKAALPAVPKLIATLKDKNADTRLAAVEALGQVGLVAWKQTLDPLKKSLNDPDRRVSEQALKSLNQVHPQWRSIGN